VDYHTTLTWLKIVQPTLNYNTNYSLNHRPYPEPGKTDSTSFKDVSNANNLSLNGSLEVGKWLSKIAPKEKKFSLDSTKISSEDWLTIKLIQSLYFGRNFFTNFVKKWNGVDVNFSQSKTNSSSGLRNEADLLYQLGWSLMPRKMESYALLAQDKVSITKNYSANTGGSLGQLSYNAGWQRSDSRTRDQNSAISSQATTWPDLSVSLNSVERFFKNVKILTSASLSSKYSRRSNKSYQDGRGDTRADTTTAWSPMILLNTRWKKQVSTQISYDYSTTGSYLPDANFKSGWKKDYTRNKKISVSGSYSFSAPQGFVLNLWKMGKKRFKFKSDLNLGLQTSYANTVSVPNLDSGIEDKDIPAEKYISDKTDISISPNATYNFTRNIKGELSGSYTRSTNKVTSNTDSKSFNLNTTVTITF
jgi:hypothetical protein